MSTLTATIQADTSGFNQGMREANEFLKKFDKNCVEAKKDLKGMKDVTENQVKALRKSVSALQAANSGLKNNSQASKACAKELEKLNLLWESLSDDAKKGDFGKQVSKQLDLASNRIKRFESELTKAKSSVKSAKSEFDGFGKNLSSELSKAVPALGDISSRLMSLSGPAAAAAAAIATIGKVIKDTASTSEIWVDDFSRGISSLNGMYTNFIQNLRNGRLPSLSELVNSYNAGASRYDAEDDLGSFVANNLKVDAAIKRKAEELRLQVEEGKPVSRDSFTELRNDIKKLNQEFDSLSNNVVNASFNSALSSSLNSDDGVRRTVAGNLVSLYRSESIRGGNNALNEAKQYLNDYLAIYLAIESLEKELSDRVRETYNASATPAGALYNYLTSTGNRLKATDVQKYQADKLIREYTNSGKSMSEFFNPLIGNAPNSFGSYSAFKSSFMAYNDFVLSEGALQEALAKDKETEDKKRDNAAFLTKLQRLEDKAFSEERKKDEERAKKYKEEAELQKEWNEWEGRRLMQKALEEYDKKLVPKSTLPDKWNPLPIPESMKRSGPEKGDRRKDLAEYKKLLQEINSLYFNPKEYYRYIVSEIESINGIADAWTGVIANAVTYSKEKEELFQQFRNGKIDIDEYRKSLEKLKYENLASIFKGLADGVSQTSKSILQLSEAIYAANKMEALSSGAASAAKLPFPYNLAAIGATVAAILSTFASFSSIAAATKFADGGIVGGNSFSGDYNIARVNSGEMILNGSQQRKLFNLLNSNSDGSIGSASVPEIKLRVSGSDLVGVWNNYNNRQNRVR